MSHHSSVTYIGGSAFSGWTGLKSIKVAEGNGVYDSRENCNAIVTKDRNLLIAGCSGIR